MEEKERGEVEGGENQKRGAVGGKREEGGRGRNKGRVSNTSLS